MHLLGDFENEDNKTERIWGLCITIFILSLSYTFINYVSGQTSYFNKNIFWIEVVLHQQSIYLPRMHGALI